MMTWSNMDAEARVAEAVRAVLAEADAEIAALKPVCQASGRCCKFEEYGHRLYVTAAELICFGEELGVPPDVNHRGTEGTEDAQRDDKGKQRRRVRLAQFFGAEKQEGCPFQVEGLCTAREARPLGCRVYFCDPAAQAWQNALYEKYHARLQALHERFGLAYVYVEWRAGLRMLVSGQWSVVSGQ